MLGFLKRAFGTSRNNIYGLDHAVLNVQLPPQSMWMNMGYWESTEDFPQACQALLEQVLAAGLLKDTSRSIRLLDVGCGCGDQSLYLMSLKRDSSIAMDGSALASASGSDTDPILRQRASGLAQSQPLLDSYIGITLEPAQAQFAAMRVRNMRNGSENEQGQTSAQIFRADAANPTSWTGDLKSSINNMMVSSADPNTTTWLLALDTMYHFRPSRQPIIHYAHHTLHASLMAFDLILTDGVSWRDRVMLRLVCWLTGSPFSNFISRQEYIDLLVAAGYDRSMIEVRDVSGHVFRGLADFLGRRVKEARPFGIKMGKYRAARVVFDWWARSGIVRGVVVVAQRS